MLCQPQSMGKSQYRIRWYAQPATEKCDNTSCQQTIYSATQNIIRVVDAHIDTRKTNTTCYHDCDCNEPHWYTDTGEMSRKTSYRLYVPCRQQRRQKREEQHAYDSERPGGMVARK